MEKNSLTEAGSQWLEQQLALRPSASDLHRESKIKVLADAGQSLNNTGHKSVLNKRKRETGPDQDTLEHKRVRTDSDKTDDHPLRPIVVNRATKRKHESSEGETSTARRPKFSV